MTSSSSASSSSMFQYIKSMEHQLHSSGQSFKDNQFLDTCLTKKSLHCRDLFFNNRDCFSPLKFSEDGTYLVSSREKFVLLWPINKVLGCERKPKPTVMQAKHSGRENYVNCLAISANNKRLISCGGYGDIFIHDTNTTQLVSMIHPNRLSLSACIGGVAMPKESDGNVFALAGFDTVLRIYDIRCSNSIPIIKTGPIIDDYLHSVDFSPANSTHLAVSGYRGTRVIDFRNDPNRSVFSFPFDNTHSVEYNRKGTRLLCCEGDKQLVIYDLLPSSNGVGKIVRLAARDYSYPFAAANSCCFAGRDDELVAATSYRENVFIWSVPDGEEEEQTIDEPLIILSGHESNVSSVCYNRHYSALASCENNKTIKVWTPFELPCYPPADGDQLTANNMEGSSSSDDSSDSFDEDSEMSSS